MLDRVHSGKYELRPAVKKLYQLCPELSTARMTSCVLRLVRNCISCVPRCVSHAYELYCKVRWVCKMSEQFEDSHTVLLYITLHTIICTHTELLNDIGNAPFLYHGTV